MISRDEIAGVLARYDKNKIAIGTLCSHSALQILHGARQEGFRTVGICTRDRVALYNSFPQARPDEFIVVDKFSDMLSEENQELMHKNNVILVPHGSLVQYVGPGNVRDKLLVPMFGNRATLEWEGDRALQRKWLVGAGLKMPEEYANSTVINKRVFVKFSGARGGSGFFTADSKEEFDSKLNDRIKTGLVSIQDAKNATIQEFVPGVRYYFQYFYSPFEEPTGQSMAGRVELLGIDKRVETIDEAYRGLPNVPEEFFDYTITGNQPVVIRESLLPEVMKMGIDTVGNSVKLFSPGMQGAFCLETVYHPKSGFRVFEVSARIVAGSNLYPQGSPYSAYLFKEPMSTGRRIAREIRTGIGNGRLGEIVY
jgi:5-formaminoimidazole-4-carboxamide-1-(beta)-D-ribofuranosyl 5'-monophosphate synthetase